MEERLIDKRDMRNFIFGVTRGFKWCFEECAVIEEAISFEYNISKSFWKDEARGGSGIMGYKRLRKSEIRKVRREIIDATLEAIRQDGFEVDHYERLFRILRIFHVPNEQIPGTRDNLKYNVALYLYELLKEDPKTLSSVAWMVSEISK